MKHCAVKKYLQNRIPIIGLLLLAVNFTGYAEPGDKGVPEQAKRDLKFARDLAEKYNRSVLTYEFAEEICNQLSNSKPNDDTRAAIAFTLADIKQAKIGLGATLEEQKTLMDEANKALDEAIKAFPTAEGVADAKFKLGEAFVKEGNAMLRQFQKEASPAKKAISKSEAEAAFTSAEQQFNTLGKEIQKKTESLWDLYQTELQKDPPNQAKIDIAAKEWEDEYAKECKAKFYYPNVLYTHASLYDEGDPNRKQKLEAAITPLTDFISEVGSSEWSWSAINSRGLCYVELGEFQTALEDFNTTGINRLNQLLTLRRTEQQADVDLNTDAVQESIQRGFTLKAQAYNRMGDYNASIQTVKEMFDSFKATGVSGFTEIETRLKDILGTPVSSQDKNDQRIKAAYSYLKDKTEIQSILLEKAQAQFYLNDVKGAFNLIDVVKNSGGEMAGPAIDLRQNLLSKISAEAMAPEWMMETLLVATKDNQFDDVIKQSKKFLSILRKASPQDRQKYVPAVLYLMWQALGARKRVYESLIVTEELYNTYPQARVKDWNPNGDSTLIMESATLDALKVCGLLATETKDKYYETKQKEIKKFRVDHGIGEDVDIIRELMSMGDYLKAVEYAKKIPPESKQYANTLANIGVCYYLHVVNHLWPDYEKETDAGKKAKLKEDSVQILNKALEAYQNYLKYGRENKDKVKDAEPEALMRMAQVYRHPALQNYAEVLNLVKDYYTTYKEVSALRSQVAESLQFNIEALINIGKQEAGANDNPRLNEANDYLEKLLKWVERYKGTGNPTAVLLEVAGEYENVANRIISEKKDLQLRARKIEELKNKDKTRYDKFSQAVEKYATYYLKRLDYSGNIKQDEALGVADRIFLAAGDLGQNNFYIKAATLYDNVLKGAYSVVSGAAQTEPWKTRYKNAQCYLKSGQWDKARGLLELVDVQHPNNAGIKFDLHTAYANLKQWDNAIKKLDEIRKGTDENTKTADGVKPWWEANYQWALDYMEMGRYPEARKLLEGLKFSNPEYDGAEYRDKFNEVEKKLKEIEPPK